MRSARDRRGGLLAPMLPGLLALWSAVPVPATSQFMAGPGADASMTGYGLTEWLSYVESLVSYLGDMRRSAASGHHLRGIPERVPLKARFSGHCGSDPSEFVELQIDNTPMLWCEHLRLAAGEHCGKPGGVPILTEVYRLRQSGEGDWLRDSRIGCDGLTRIDEVRRVELVYRHDRRMSETVGIDLGTTFTSIAKAGPTGCERIKNEVDSHDFPSVVIIDGDSCALHVDPERLPGAPGIQVSYVKRLIGRDFKNKMVQQVRSRMRGGPLELIEQAGAVMIAVKNTTCIIHPVDVEAKILGYAKEQMERHEGAVLGPAVISVPTGFDDVQRVETLRAAEAAGIEVLRLVPEPVLAAYSHFLSQPKDRDRGLILVVDLGGGTFEAVLMSKRGLKFEVLGKEGVDVGGMDLTHCMYERLRAQLEHDMPLSDGDRQHLYRLAETAKVRLNQGSMTVHEVRFWQESATGQSRRIKVYRKEFEEWCKDEIGEVVKLLRRLLDFTKTKTSEIDQVLMVGGSSFIHAVRERVEGFVGQKVMVQDPRAAVACGAAGLASRLSRGVEEIKDTLPYSLGLRAMRGSCADLGEDLARKTPECCIMDKILSRGEPLPAAAVESHCNPFPTGKSAILNLDVLAGEKDLASDNELIKKFSMEVPEAGACELKHDINYTVDRSGILTAEVIPRNFELKDSLRSVSVRVPVMLLPQQLNASVVQELRHAHDLEAIIEQKRRLMHDRLDRYEECLRAMDRAGRPPAEVESMRATVGRIRGWGTVGGRRDIDNAEAEGSKIVADFDILDTAMRGGCATKAAKAS